MESSRHRNAQSATKVLQNGNSKPAGVSCETLAACREVSASCVFSFGCGNVQRLGHCSKTAELVETAILYYDQWRRGALKSADAKSVRVCCNGRKCGKKDRDKRRISSFNSFSSVEQSRGSSPYSQYAGQTMWKAIGEARI